MIETGEHDSAVRSEPVAESATIAARYGRTPAKRSRQRKLYIAVSAVVALVVIGWVLWAGLGQSAGTIEAKDTGATVLNERSVSIRYRVSMPVGSTAKCALQVQNYSHGIVGWRITEITASTRYTTSHTAVLLSSEPAVTGLIYRCWLT